MLAVVWATCWWALAVFAFQEYTLRCNYPLRPDHALVVRSTRLVLDLFACGLLVLALNRYLRIVSLVMSAVAARILTVYFEYFGHALSWHTIQNQAGEGLVVGAFALELLN